MWHANMISEAKIVIGQTKSNWQPVVTHTMPHSYIPKQTTYQDTSNKTTTIFGIAQNNRQLTCNVLLFDSINLVTKLEQKSKTPSHGCESRSTM